jgi:hypothetical protein
MGEYSVCGKTAVTGFTDHLQPVHSDLQPAQAMRMDECANARTSDSLQSIAFGREEEEGRELVPTISSSNCLSVPPGPQSLLAAPSRPGAQR